MSTEHATCHSGALFLAIFSTSYHGEYGTPEHRDVFELITDNSCFLICKRSSSVTEIINVLKNYFIAYSFLPVDFLFVAIFDIKIKKNDKSQTNISN